MEVVRGNDPLPPATGPAVVTIGFFDGVHRGHQAVIRRMVEAASEAGLVPVAVTFDRHPREILSPGRQPPLLTSTARKAALIAELGAAFLVVLRFDEEFSRWSPEDFVERVLTERLRAARVVVGTNFTFGHKAMGTVAVLTELGSTHGFSVQGVPLLSLDGRPVSSSSIRDALAAGDLEWPARALGRRFLVDGRVVTGAGRGRGMGFPTANLRVPPGMLLPAQGVYAGKAHIGERSFVAAVNVGTNPTFGTEPVHVEAFLLEFDQDVRGKDIAVEFWERLRDEVRFESAQQLARQIADDVERTRAVVG